jgi:hypothetical protein
MSLTNVSAGKLGGLLGLNRTDSGLAVCSVVIVPIPPHTPNINQHTLICSSLIRSLIASGFRVNSNPLLMAI